MSNDKPKKKTALFLLTAIVLVISILLFINSRTIPSSSFVTEGRNKLAVTGEVAVASNSSSLIYCVEDLLIEAQDDVIRAKNIKGNVTWSQKLPGKVVKLADTGKSIVIVDSINNIYYYSLKGKLLWTYKSDYEIIDIFTQNNGSFLVEYKGMTGSHAEVFAQNSSKVGSISVENAHILSFSSGDDEFSISVLDTSSETIKTKVITYNFKGDILRAHNFDNIIISKLSYNKDNKLLAMGENSIYIYKSDGSLQEEAIIEGKISNVALSDSIVAVALYNKGKQYLVCYDANMREQSRIEIKDAPLGIFILKNSFIPFYNDELLILTSKGELIAKYKPNTDISSVYMNSDNKVYIVSNRRLQMLEYIN